MEWIYDDGGREAAGFKGKAGDCACRAVAIAAQMEYGEVYKLINEYGKHEHISKRKSKKSSARDGVYNSTLKKIMASLGWEWVPTMKIGQGCTVHLNAAELPAGRIIARLSKHYTAVIDGVVHDTYDPNYYEDEFGDPTERCVYGYYRKAGAEDKSVAGMFKLTVAEVHELTRVSEMVDGVRRDLEDEGRCAAIVKKLNEIDDLLYSILWE